MEETDDGYTLTLFFNDQPMSGKGKGIPETAKPAYDPLKTIPDTGDFTDYLTRGYSTLHNLAANVVLKLETNDATAKISVLSAPLPSSNDQTD